MSYSTTDELEAIEQSARLGPAAGRGHAPAPAPAARGGPRRGSSIFSAPGGAKPIGGPTRNGDDSGGDDLLVDFPGSDDDLYDSDEGEGGYQQPVNTSEKASGVVPQINPISIAASTSSAPPPRNGGEGGGPRRDSVVLKPISGLGGLVDFDDSDFDDSDDDDAPGYSGGLPGAPMPGVPGGGNAPGGQNHRPLVGGFAAAAYEAARAYHYQSQSKGKPAKLPERRGPPPSI